MNIDEFVAAQNQRDDLTIRTPFVIGEFDGVENVARLDVRRKRPIAGASFNSWTWMCPLTEDGIMLTDWPFVYSQEWFDYCDTRNEG